MNAHLQLQRLEQILARRQPVGGEVARDANVKELEKVGARVGLRSDQIDVRAPGRTITP